jgi:hypothetical protein
MYLADEGKKMVSNAYTKNWDAKFYLIVFLRNLFNVEKFEENIDNNKNV